MNSFQKPIIDLRSFIQSGACDVIKLGQTKEWISNNFPTPDSQFDEEMQVHGFDIWTYGHIELHFKEEELYLIHSDHWPDGNITAGDNIHLKKWIFSDIESLDLISVLEALNSENIDYSKSSNELGCHLLLKSGVEMTFENLTDLEDMDHNFYQLTSFSLTNKS